MIWNWGLFAVPLYGLDIFKFEMVGEIPIALGDIVQLIWKKYSMPPKKRSKIAASSSTIAYDSWWFVSPERQWKDIKIGDKPENYIPKRGFKKLLAKKYKVGKSLLSNKEWPRYFCWKSFMLRNTRTLKYLCWFNGSNLIVFQWTNSTTTKIHLMMTAPSYTKPALRITS